jgi:lipoprotein LprG
MRSLGRWLPLALVGLLAACSQANPPPPNSVAVLRAASTALRSVHSFTADITFGPGITYGGLALKSATSRVDLPGNSDTVFKVEQGDFLVDLEVVTVDGSIYLRLPFSQFTQLPVGDASRIPDLSRLLDPDTGLGRILPVGSGATYLGTATVEGVTCQEVRARYSPSQIGQAIGGIRPAGEVTATIWAGAHDHLPRKVVLQGPLFHPGRDVQITVLLHSFNQPVTIARPSPTP